MKLRVHLPVRVDIDLERGVLRRHQRAERRGLIDLEVVENQPGADGVARREVRADLVRVEVGIRQEVLARDFSLPPDPQSEKPGSSGSNASLAAVDGSSPSKRRSGKTASVTTRPCVNSYAPRNVHASDASASPLRSDGVLELERQIRQARDRRRVGAHVEHMQAVTPRLHQRIRGPLHVASRRGSSSRPPRWCIRSSRPRVGVRVVLGQIVPDPDRTPRACGRLA